MGGGRGAHWRSSDRRRVAQYCGEKFVIIFIKPFQFYFYLFFFIILFCLLEFDLGLKRFSQRQFSTDHLVLF